MSAPVPPSFGQMVALALRLRSELVETGAPHAEAECPRCGCLIKARLGGRKRHLRLACETPNCFTVLE